MSGGEQQQSAQKGNSPWVDAWRRLKKNTMAMVGLVVTIVMGFSALLAPFGPFDANTGFTWIGPQPPGYEHPACLNKNVLRIGRAPDAGERYLNAREISFQAKETRTREVQISLRRGKVRLIQLTKGAERLKSLAVQGPEQVLVDLTDPEAEGAQFQDVTVVPKKPLPEAILAAFPGKPPRKLIMEQRFLEKDVTYAAKLDAEGLITELTRNGEPRERVEISGINVLAGYADGQEQRYSHLLGTDIAGRDLFSRILYGGRISLLVGLVATIVSLLVGVVYGAVSGYFGGKVDGFLMAVVDILYGIPYMFLVILLLVNFGSNILILFAALGAVQWLTMARIVRGQILSLKQKEFVEAARMSGTGHWGILFNHLIPNTLGVVVVYTTLTVPAVILQESFLAFIGLTVTYNGEALESWGALVKIGSDALGQGGSNWWLLIYPSIAMAATLFSLNFLGDGLRDALDPQQRGRT